MQAFEAFGGVPHALLYDNLKTDALERVGDVKGPSDVRVLLVISRAVRARRRAGYVCRRWRDPGRAARRAQSQKRSASRSRFADADLSRS
jgi:hypothetical protein